MTTSTSSDAARRRARVAVLPVGAFEQHGDHLPLITDTAIACLIARRLDEAYPELMVLPPVTISCSHEHSGFPGTVSISPATLIAVVTDIRADLARSGIAKLVIVNAHGGNYVLSNLAQQANVGGVREVVLFPGRADWEQARASAGMETDAHEDMHGGELETSVLLHAAPELVGAAYRTSDTYAPDRPHLHVLGMEGYTQSGIIGRPSAATAAKGELVLDSLTKAFETYLNLLAPDFPLQQGNTSG